MGFLVGASFGNAGAVVEDVGSKTFGRFLYGAGESSMEEEMCRVVEGVARGGKAKGRVC